VLSLQAKEFQSCIFYVANKPIEHVKSFLHPSDSFTSESWSWSWSWGFLSCYWPWIHLTLSWHLQAASINYLLLNRTRSTEYSMKINELRSQLTRANVRNNVVQLFAG